ncbi:MAG: hypothetical protein WDN01_16785 [Rhizomicrobium sp.]
MTGATPSPGLGLFSVSLQPDWSLSIQVSFWVGLALIVGVVIYFLWRWYYGSAAWKNFEIDRAEIGVGTGKLTLKPNMTDRQVAYSIWVELSTRKIGLPIDFEHDVIAEIYDSWHTFFSVTRDLIKSVPVNKVRHGSTQKIIKLSIEVLNDGLRPHLTKWQARFRRWYDYELGKVSGELVIDPQDIQQKFPKWAELKTDMERVNGHLMHYREKMRLLVLTD